MIMIQDRGQIKTNPDPLILIKVGMTEFRGKTIGNNGSVSNLIIDVLATLKRYIFVNLIFNNFDKRVQIAQNEVI